MIGDKTDGPGSSSHISSDLACEEEPDDHVSQLRVQILTSHSCMIHLMSTRFSIGWQVSATELIGSLLVEAVSQVSQVKLRKEEAMSGVVIFVQQVTFY